MSEVTSLHENNQQSSPSEIIDDRTSMKHEEEEEGSEIGASPIMSLEWQELMGRDLQLLVVDSPNPDAPSLEAGDVVFVDFVGRVATEADHPRSPNKRSMEQMHAVTMQALNDSPSDDDASSSSSFIEFHRAKQWLVTIGDKEVTPALELGLRFMREGESATIYSHSKFAYGPFSRQSTSSSSLSSSSSAVQGGMPPNANVVYHVTMTRVVKDASILKSPQFQYIVAQSKKSMGNDVFTYEWHEGQGRNKALLLYKKSAEMMQNVLVQLQDQDVDDEEDWGRRIREECWELMCDSLNNTAAVYLRCREYRACKDASTEVLKHDAHNMKALLRAARACMLDPASSLLEAEAAVQAAEQSATTVQTPKNKTTTTTTTTTVSPAIQTDLVKLRNELKRQQRKYKQSSKAMYSKMMGGNNNSNKKKESSTMTDDEPSKSTHLSKSSGGQKDEPEVTPEKEEAEKVNISKQDHVATTTPSATQDQQQEPWYIKYRPLIIQAILPMITYSLFLIARHYSQPQTEEDTVADAIRSSQETPEVASEF